jgi:hypothetical protein
MRGAIPPLPNTPSWRGASLSTGTTLPLLYLYVGSAAGWFGTGNQYKILNLENLVTETNVGQNLFDRFKLRAIQHERKKM